MEEACFGAGCFWGVQDAFNRLDGVVKTIVGYMGGTTKNPSYEEVCTNTTGHAEVVYILYDPSVITYERLLEYFFKIHDPTQKNRQGMDVGLQYRSVIFYYNEKQKRLAKEFIEKMHKLHSYPTDIMTEIAPVSKFYKAEEYHQDYFKKNGRFGCFM